MMALAAIAASAAIPMATFADTDGTVTINGVTWKYTDRDDTAKTVTIGTSGTMAYNSFTTAIPTGTQINAANIPWTMEIDGETYTVTKVGKYAFANCTKLTGALAIPSTVTSIGERSFWHTGLTAISSLGGVITLGPYAFYNISSLQGDFPDLLNVTSFSQGPFLTCTTLEGGVVLNPTLTSIPTRCFENSGLTKITIPRTVTSISESAFKQTKLTAFMLRGPADVTSGSQTYATLNTQNAFPGCDRLKVLLFGKNTKGNSSNLNSGNMLTDVTGCTVFVPTTGWNGLVTGGENNEVIYYGSGRDIDIEMDDDSKTITATPTTVYTLTNVLNAAVTLKSEYGWNTRISVTNAIDLTGVTITDNMVKDATFDRLMFSAKTQAQLTSILETFPATTPISIDPTGLTENMVILNDYPNVFVKTVPGVTIKRTAKGFMIIVK